MKISIHQPNFMPWYPFFQKIIGSDIFVILQHCQFEKNNFQNRFNVADKWHTMSVNKGLESIIDKRYINHIKDWNKIKINLSQYDLNVFDGCIYDELAKTNINIILKIIEILDIKTKIVYDYKTELKSSERLIDLIHNYDCDTYLSGAGARKYLNIEDFEKNNIKILFQDDIQNIVKEPIIKIIKKYV